MGDTDVVCRIHGRRENLRFKDPRIPNNFQNLTSANVRFRLIVFDLDGTLVDSRRDLAESANALLEQCGLRPLAEDAIGRMVGDGAATLVARLFAASSLPQPADALARFL